MNKTELDELIKRAKKAFGISVTVIVKDSAGNRITEVYTLCDVKIIGFEKVGEGDPTPPENDMSYSVFAILENLETKEKLDIFPLELVLEAIKERKYLYQDYFDQNLVKTSLIKN